MHVIQEDSHDFTLNFRAFLHLFNGNRIVPNCKNTKTCQNSFKLTINAQK